MVPRRRYRKIIVRKPHATNTRTPNEMPRSRSRGDRSADQHAARADDERANRGVHAEHGDGMSVLSVYRSR
jgi:hypothetical protein